MNAFFTQLRVSSLRALAPIALALALAPTGCGFGLEASAQDGGVTGVGGASGSSTVAAGTGTTSGAGGAPDTGAGSSGTGAFESSTPYFNGSYSYLCGESDPACVPGTEDCTPGGDPGMGNSGAGGTMISCLLLAEGGKAKAACAPVGDFAAGAPCETAAHCGAGLGCVATASGSLCRAYCCEDVEACEVDTYCAPLPMSEAAIKVPVCTPVKKCKPLDDSTCDNGQTCTIVRDDGTTSCVDAGAGLRGDSCPCAPGYVCSKINNTCLKLCHLGNDADCAGGTCQGGVMGYPEGIGVCVGYP